MKTEIQSAHLPLRSGRRKFALHLILLLGLILASARASAAATFYWDADPTENDCSAGTGMGGAGSWDASEQWLDYGDGTDPFWCTSNKVAWAASNTAVFTGTAGTVTLSDVQTAGGLTFKKTGFTIAGSTLTLDGDATLTCVTGTGTLTTLLAGTVGYNVIGPGTIRLNQINNTISGPVNVSGNATLRLTSSGHIGSTAADSGDVTLDGGTLRVDQTAVGATFLTANRNIIIGPAGGTLYTAVSAFDPVTGSGVDLYAGIISGTGNTVTKTGLGEMRAYKSNTFGKLVVSAGMWTCSQGTTGNEKGFGAAPTTYTADAITVNDAAGIGCGITATTPANRGIYLASGGGSLVTRSSGQTWTIASIISGPGSLYMNGNNSAGAYFGGSSGGEVRLTGASTYAGNTFVRFGTLRISSGSNRLPATTVLTMGSPNSANCFFYLGLTTTPRNQTLAGLASQDLHGSVRNGASTATTTATLTLNQDIDTSFGGVLGGPGANEDNLVLVKNGVGTLTLDGVNTYTGGTTINAGTLAVGAGSINGSLQVDLNGGTLRTSGPDKLSDNGLVNLAGGTLELGGNDTVLLLQIDGIPQLPGTWGAPGSGAAKETTRITGPGILTVTAMAPSSIVSIVSNGGGTASLTFQGTPETQYYVLTSTDPAAAMDTWTPVPGSTNAAPSPSGVWSLNVDSTSGQRFYRAVALNPAP